VNAPIRNLAVAPPVDIADFLECCSYQLWFIEKGWITKQVAVDAMQFLADAAGYVDEVGQAEIQRLMAQAFAPAEIDPPPLAPASPDERARPYRPPQATIDAFFYLVRQDDADRLTAWLSNHPRDAAHLHEIWKSKHAVT
jgi:hypothetical protein